MAVLQLGKFERANGFYRNFGRLERRSCSQVLSKLVWRGFVEAWFFGIPTTIPSRKQIGVGETLLEQNKLFSTNNFLSPSQPFCLDPSSLYRLAVKVRQLHLLQFALRPSPSLEWLRHCSLPHQLSTPASLLTRAFLQIPLLTSLCLGLPKILPLINLRLRCASYSSFKQARPTRDQLSCTTTIEANR